MKDFPLQTNRLIIRQFSMNDADDLYEYLSLSDTYIFEPGEPIDQKQALAMCKERAAGNNFFAVELIHEKKMIGHLYFQQAQPAEFMTWELGYIFNPKYQSKGYCTEAAQAIIAYAFEELMAHKVTAFCNPHNIASWRVLEKCGMTREGHFKEKAFFRKDTDGNPLWHDCYAYGILAGNYHQ
jgi:RimJ/RimL family protein N-acetyltransferase